MILIKVNNYDFLVKKEISIIEACRHLGIILPRFCYHELLSISGNCRMCLVEIESIEKPVAACVTEVESGMCIYTNSLFTKKARENVIEALLINHPLDCPICDQAGECDLQDQAKNFGSNYSRFYLSKRAVEDKNCGPLIKTVMTRCIHCTRCVRFGSEIAGIDYLGTLSRGNSTEIGSYVTTFFNSEISGNVIDLCPVGALTSKPYTFRARPWELRIASGLDLTDGFGSNIYVNFKETEIVRILPRVNTQINTSIISDKARFSYDFFTKNRIKYISKFNDIHEIIDWKTFLKSMSLVIKNGGNFLILVDEELDLDHILLLKALEYKYCEKIKIKTIHKLRTKSNLYANFLSGKAQQINDIEFFILLGCNLKLEATLLNARLRSWFKTRLISVIGLGSFYKNNLPILFINLSISGLLKIFEGKNEASKEISKKEKILFFLGQSFIKKVANTNVLLCFFKSIINAIFININLKSNTEGIAFGSIKNVSRKDLNEKPSTIGVNLESVLAVDDTTEGTKKFIWFNTHGSKLASKYEYVVPTLTSFEQDEIHINLEKRPQSTTKIINTTSNSRKLKNIFKYFFNYSLNKKKLAFSTFIKELILNDTNFDFIKMNIGSIILEKKKKNYSSFFSYPIKTSIEDYYLSNKITKNSLTMANCSRLIRHQHSNFNDFNYKLKNDYKFYYDSKKDLGFDVRRQTHMR